MWILPSGLVIEKTKRALTHDVATNPSPFTEASVVSDEDLALDVRIKSKKGPSTLRLFASTRDERNDIVQSLTEIRDTLKSGWSREAFSVLDASARLELVRGFGKPKHIIALLEGRAKSTEVKGALLHSICDLSEAISLERASRLFSSRCRLLISYATSLVSAADAPPPATEGRRARPDKGFPVFICPSTRSKNILASRARVYFEIALGDAMSSEHPSDMAKLVKSHICLADPEATADRPALYGAFENIRRNSRLVPQAQDPSKRSAERRPSMARELSFDNAGLQSVLDLPLDSFRSLVTLSLRFNNLITFDVSALSSAMLLETLNVEYCAISTIVGIANLPSLHRLFLAGNQLKDIDAVVIAFAPQRQRLLELSCGACPFVQALVDAKDWFSVYADYRFALVNAFPSLAVLDYLAVTEGERYESAVVARARAVREPLLSLHSPDPYVALSASHALSSLAAVPANHSALVHLDVLRALLPSLHPSCPPAMHRHALAALTSLLAPENVAVTDIAVDEFFITYGGCRELCALVVATIEMMSRAADDAMFHVVAQALLILLDAMHLLSLYLLGREKNDYTHHNFISQREHPLRTIAFRDGCLAAGYRSMELLLKVCSLARSCLPIEHSASIELEIGGASLVKTTLSLICSLTLFVNESGSEDPEELVKFAEGGGVKEVLELWSIVSLAHRPLFFVLGSLLLLRVAASSLHSHLSAALANSQSLIAFTRPFLADAADESETSTSSMHVVFVRCLALTWFLLVKENPLLLLAQAKSCPEHSILRSGALFSRHYDPFVQLAFVAAVALTARAAADETKGLLGDEVVEVMKRVPLDMEVPSLVGDMEGDVHRHFKSMPFLFVGHRMDADGLKLFQ